MKRGREQRVVTLSPCVPPPEAPDLPAEMWAAVTQALMAPPAPLLAPEGGIQFPRVQWLQAVGAWAQTCHANYQLTQAVLARGRRWLDDAQATLRAWRSPLERCAWTPPFAAAVEVPLEYWLLLAARDSPCHEPLRWDAQHTTGSYFIGEAYADNQLRAYDVNGENLLAPWLYDQHPRPLVVPRYVGWLLTMLVEQAHVGVGTTHWTRVAWQRGSTPGVLPPWSHLETDPVVGLAWLRLHAHWQWSRAEKAEQVIHLSHELLGTSGAEGDRHSTHLALLLVLRHLMPWLVPPAQGGPAVGYDDEGTQWYHPLLDKELALPDDDMDALAAGRAIHPLRWHCHGKWWRDRHRISGWDLLTYWLPERQVAGLVTMAGTWYSRHGAVAAALGPFLDSVLSYRGETEAYTTPDAARTMQTVNAQAGEWVMMNDIALHVALPDRDDEDI